jgi:hypothetical protein
VRRLLAAAAVVLLAGCASPPPPYDYGPYLAHMPRSILVIPPLNESPDPVAPYSFLSSITAPIAEHGYYVFPVAVVAEMMKENGCPTPGEMHQAPIEKLREVFGADAVLYLTVKRWGTDYHVLNSETMVSVTGRLVDLRTGDEFWASAASAEKNSAEGQRDVFSMMAAAIINQIVAGETDPAHDLAPIASYGLVLNTHHGMLLGPYHPGYAAEQTARRAAPDGPPPKLPEVQPDAPPAQ